MTPSFSAATTGVGAGVLPGTLAEPAPEPPLLWTPARAGRHVSIRPVVPADRQWLYELAVSSDRGDQWRLQGSVPPFDEFVGVLFTRCRATFAVERCGDGVPVGLCQLFDFDAYSRTAQVAATIGKGAEVGPWAGEGILLFLDYAFSCYSLRKVYIEVTDAEAERYRAAAGHLLASEGRLSEHRLVFGRHVDIEILALRRADFLAARAELLPVVEAVPPQGFGAVPPEAGAGAA